MRTLSTLVAAVALVVGLAGCDSSTDPPGGEATASGTVTNSFGYPLQGAEVTMTSTSDAAGGTAQRSGSVGCTTTTNAGGQFSCPGLPAGTYTVTITVPGYGTQTFTATVSGSGTVTLSVPPTSGNGNINAQIINAVTGVALAGATVECRRVLPDGSVSGVEFTATANGSGQVQLNGLFLGEAQCTATAGGVTIPLGITITPETTGTIPATPPPAAGQYRIVLTWGESPSDLDSHLTGPDGSGGRFHVYYSNLSFGETTLDLDDTSAFGPETITVTPTVDGMYRYSVHNYSNQGTSGAESMHASGATVRVYTSSGLYATFVAPPAPATGGNTWRVFEVRTSATGSPLISGLPPNGIGYFQASSSGDIETFLTGGPAPEVGKVQVL